MTLAFNTTVPPTQSANVQNVDWIVTTTPSVSLGSVLLLPTGTDGYVTTGVNVTAASVGVPGANIVEDGWFGVVVDLMGGGGAAGTQVKVRVKGVVDALGTAGGGGAAWAADQYFAADATPSNILFVSIVGTAGEANKKLIAAVTASEASTHQSTALRTVVFDGINGFARAGGAV